MTEHEETNQEPCSSDTRPNDSYFSLSASVYFARATRMIRAGVEQTQLIQRLFEDCLTILNPFPPARFGGTSFETPVSLSLIGQSLFPPCK